MTYVLQFANRAECAFAVTDDRRSRYSERSRRCLPPTVLSAMARPGTVALTQPENRESDLFQEMFLSSRARFVGLAYSILQNREDAEDAVQDALLSGFVHLRAFEGRSAFTTWFSRIVLNAALMIRRKQKNRRVDSMTDFCGEDETPWVERMPSPHPDPEKIYAREEACELLNRLAAKLNPMLRQALTMAHGDEMSSSEAAATLGVSTSTFKSRVLRARLLLAKRAAVAFTPRKPTICRQYIAYHG